MNWFFYTALISAFVGIVPLLIVKRFTAAIWFGAVGFFVLWGIYYLAAPSTVWPLYGLPGFCVLVMWVISAVIAGMDSGNPGFSLAFPIAGVVVFVLTGIYGSSIFNASTYASLLGQVEDRTWTQDVQPKDPRHMRMVSYDNAMYIAKKAVAQAGTMSQFSLDAKRMTLQRVKGQLVYVIPFDFREFSTWLNSSGVPGFIIVDAEDSERAPRFVQLPQGQLMQYTPGAFWGHALERHLRNNGFLNDGLAAFRFELDEEERPWWVATTYQLSVSWWGEKVTGVATVNPSTGEIARYSVDKAPAWIDRIIPAELVKQYVAWRGKYVNGWKNSWWDKLNLTKPEDPILIWGSDDRAEWVTGVTSHNDKDDSLVGLMYTDSRTGKTVYYGVNGGATDTAIVNAVNANQQVKFRHLYATTPQIYNVYGSMAAVVPLLNDSNAFQGVAIVEVTNVQDVAVGMTQSEALHNYQTLLFRRGQQVALEKSPSGRKLEGVVDRIRQDVGQNGGVYYLHIAGAPRIFTASSQDYVKLALTQPGDKVVVEYVASGEETVPLRSFDNISLPLDKTAMQDEVESVAKARQTVESTRKSSSEIISKIKAMKPEEIQRLEQLLQK